MVKITEEGPLFRTNILDEEGNIVGCEEELDQVHADSTIIAISQGPKNKLLLTTPDLEFTETGLLTTDENGMTTVDGVFSAGDVVTGSKNVVSAVAASKAVAEAMMRYMEGKEER